MSRRDADEMGENGRGDDNKRRWKEKTRRRENRVKEGEEGRR